MKPFETHSHLHSQGFLTSVPSSSTPSLCPDPSLGRLQLSPCDRRSLREPWPQSLFTPPVSFPVAGFGWRAAPARDSPPGRGERRSPVSGVALSWWVLWLRFRLSPRKSEAVYFLSLLMHKRTLSVLIFLWKPVYSQHREFQFFLLVWLPN